jgi:hypothetical protein
MACMLHRVQTYSARDLDVLDQHYHFLASDEGLEVLPGLPRGRWLDLRSGSVPDDASRDGKQVPHELALTGDLDFNRPVAKTRRSASSSFAIVTVDRRNRVVERHELHVRIVGLAADSVHDDVHRLLFIVQQLGVPAQQCNDLRPSDTVGDLWMIAVVSPTQRLSQDIKNLRFEGGRPRAPRHCSVLPAPRMVRWPDPEGWPGLECLHLQQ